MTIGPDPMTKIFSMSLRRGMSADHRQVAVEEVGRVVGARPGFRVVLGARGLHVLEREALDRAVVEVQVGQPRRPEVRLPAHTLAALECALTVWSRHSEAMVLAGDVDAPGEKVLDGVVRPPVAEGQQIG